MKKSLIMLLMGLFLLPSGLFADNYETERLPDLNGIPIKTPAMHYIGAWIDSETGVFSIYANYDTLYLYVTIEQSEVVLDSFSQVLYNGVPATYNFSSYNTGEYIVTLSTGDGMIVRYCVKVVKD